MFYALLLLCLSGIALAMVHEIGKCPVVEYQKNFDVEKILGVWHEYKSYDEIEQNIAKCTHFKFSRDENGTVHAVHEFILRGNGMRYRIPGILEPSKTTEAAKLLLWNPYSLGGGDLSQFFILATDYTSYAITYNCANGEMHNCYHSTVIYTRDKNPSISVITSIKAVAKRYNITYLHFVKVKQTDCTMTASK